MQPRIVKSTSSSPRLTVRSSGQHGFAILICLVGAFLSLGVPERPLLKP